MSLSENGLKLKEYISSFSERWYCAGWRSNVEYYIWNLGHQHETIDTNDIEWALCIYESQLIVKKAEEFGIWLYWNPRANTNQPEEMTMIEWIRRYHMEMIG